MTSQVLGLGLAGHGLGLSLGLVGHVLDSITDAGIVSERIKISSNFFLGLVACSTMIF